MEEKIPFLDIFSENQVDGSLTARHLLRVNGIDIPPATIFQKGVSVAGIDFHQFKYWDIAVKKNQDGSIQILGFYEM